MSGDGLHLNIIKNQEENNRPKIIPSISLMFPVPETLFGSFSPNETSFGLLGPSRCCKTSLMFQAAVKILKHHPGEDHTILILRPDVIKYPPHHVHQMDQANSRIARQILIQYFDSADQLMEYLAGYYINEYPPLAIIIDDLDGFSTKNVIKNRYVDPRLLMTKLLSLLMDTRLYCSQKNQMPCYIMVTGKDDVRNDPGNINRLVPLFMDNTYYIKRIAGPIDQGTIDTSVRKDFKMTVDDEHNLYYYVDNDISRAEIFLSRVTRVKKS